MKTGLLSKLSASDGVGTDLSTAAVKKALAQELELKPKCKSTKVERCHCATAASMRQDSDGEGAVAKRITFA